MDANTKPVAHQHILRPHHVVLLTLFMLVFREYDSKSLPQPFLLHIYRLLMNEVSEVCVSNSDCLYEGILHGS